MFIYEMHQHTARCSACGVVEPDEIVRALKEEGFAGMVLTNHFIHGNTGIRRQMPWVDFVRPYEEAYLQAKEEGDRLDFDVIFGMEEGVGGGKEVLLYGITPQWLYDHPELRDGGGRGGALAHIAKVVHEVGGLVYQAHPFRVRDYIQRPWEPLPSEYLDGIEGYNANNPSLDNARAVLHAEKTGLPMIAGSDCHTVQQNPRYGIVAPHRLRTGAELVETLRAGEYELYIPGV